MGFNEKWVHLILQCVKSVSYRVVLHKHKICSFYPSRGVRQSDPLSPFLFIICAEGISALIRHHETQKWIHDIKICRRASSITHMLFADDNYLYCRANEKEVLKILDFLRNLRVIRFKRLTFTSVFQCKCYSV